MITSKIKTKLVPLSEDDTGTIRVGKSRVRLDSVVYAFNQGHTPEEILMQFPTLDLADIYSVIAYYLNHKTAVDEYMERTEAEGDKLRREIEAQPEYQAFRKRVLARRETQLNEGKNSDSA